MNSLWHSHSDNRKWQSSKLQPKYYIPFTVRTPWLLTVLVAVLACIGVLEAGFNTGIKGGGHNDVGSSKVRRQGDPTPETTDSSAYLDTETTTSPSSTTPTSKATTSGGTTTEKTSGTPTSSGQSAASYATAGGYITIATSTPTQKETSNDGNGETTAFLTASSDYITLSTASSDYVSITTDQTADVTPAYSTSEGYITISTTATSDGSTFVVETTSPTTFLASIPNSDTASLVSAVQTNDPTISSSETVYTVESKSTITALATLSDGSVTLTTSVETFTSASTSVLATPGTVKHDQIQLGIRFTHSSYFMASYLAVILAVVLKLTWSMVFSSLKLMEPFYQLSKPGGATAQESLLADYLAPGYSLSHLLHISSGHWVMLFATIAGVAIGILAPLSTECMTVVSTAFCSADDGGRQPCNPVWVINSDIARGLEAVLGVTAVFILLVIICNLPRNSGLFSNPSSIATMASLLSHEDILDDFRHLDQAAKDKQLAAALTGNRYTISNFELDATMQAHRYGLTKSTSSSLSSPYDLAPSRNFDRSSRAKYAALANPSAGSLTPSSTYSFDRNPYEQYSNSYHLEPCQNPIVVSSTAPFSLNRRTIRDIIFLLCLLALLGIVVGYYLDGSSSDFNDFFNSNTFGPRFILTGVATIFDFHWKTLEREVRILVPYRRIGQGKDADARHTVLVDVAGTPLSSIWGSVARQEWFHTVVAFTAILSDVLIVAIAGVPFSSAQIRDSFLVSAYLSMSILSVMILTLAGIFMWRMGIKKLRMPREPTNLLDVWLMLCDESNTVRETMARWEMTEAKERDEFVKGKGGIYSGGWIGGRWCVSVQGGQGLLMKG